MPHEVDASGYPTDPHLRALQAKLGDLAAEWREVYRGVEGQRDIVSDYHAVMAELYALGWDDMLDIDAELPEVLMPAEYVKRHPRV